MPNLFINYDSPVYKQALSDCQSYSDKTVCLSNLGQSIRKMNGVHYFWIDFRHDRVEYWVSKDFLDNLKEAYSAFIKAKRVKFHIGLSI